MDTVAAPCGSPAVLHLHRYYGFLRHLRALPGGLRSPLTTRYRSSAETWRSPTFVVNPSESVPRARDSGGPRDPRLAVPVMRPSVRLTTSASATRKISELNPRGPLPCCLRFTSPVTRRRCKTRYRPARCGVDRAGFAPAGLHSGVSRAHDVPPLPRFRGAITVNLSAQVERLPPFYGNHPAGEVPDAAP